MKVVILAAGMGTRINKDRETVPKPLYTLGSKSLLEHCLLNFKKAGLTDFVIVVGFMAENIINHLGDGSRYGVRITYVINEEYRKPLGRSILAASRYVQEPFLLSMSDHIMDFEGLKRIVDYPLPDNGCALLVDKKIDTIFWLDDAAKVKLEGNLIRAVDKKLQHYEAIDCGVFKCSPAIFDEIRKSLEHPDSMSAAVTSFSSRDRMFAVDIGPYRWVDVDEYDELEAAREIFRQEPS